MTYLEEYFTALLDGKINACEKMKLISEKILQDLYSPNEYHFDEEIANKHIEFIEKFCKTPSGRLGTPLKLQLFQKARLQAIFGFVDDNNLRKYNEVLIVEGRKNGKTTECAATELDVLTNDGEGAPQIYNVATQREQATLGFNACHKMVNQSPLLHKHIRKRAADLYCSLNFGYIKALASNTTALDGLDVHMATIDELSAIKNRDLYDLVKQGMGARSQPLLFCISTNGFVRNGIFDAQYQYASDILYGKAVNDRFLPFIYELDDADEWDKEECWVKANPGIDTIKSRDYLRQMVRKAKDDISFKPTVMVKDFNVPQNRASSWLKWEEIANEYKTPADAKFRYCIGGMDAADSIDLNAAKILCMRPGDEHIYLKSMYWIPQEAIDRFEDSGKRQGRDNVPYTLWKDQGYLRTVPGNKVDKEVFLEWFCEMRDEKDIYVLYVGYDPWHIDESLLRKFRNEFGQESMIPVRQGVKTLSNPMKDMRADMGKHLIVHDDNPIDKWNLANMEVTVDINGNIQPVKGLDQRNRIDGGMALIDGYIVLKNKYDEYQSVI